jgi:hypothetical protein
LPLALLLAVALTGGELAEARHGPDQVLPVIQVDDLPREARDTLALIKQGGPFPYKRDGVVFGNRERRLPSQPRGYYRWFGGNWDALQDCLGDLSWRTAPGYVVALEHCQGLAKRARADVETLLEVLATTADFWREQGIPFWVLVGGVSEGLRDFPRLGKGA